MQQSSGTGGKNELPSYLERIAVAMMDAMNRRDYSNPVWDYMSADFEAQYENGHRAGGKRHLELLKHITEVVYPDCKGTITGLNVSVDQKNGAAEIVMGVETTGAPMGGMPVQQVGIQRWRREEGGEWKWVKYLAMNGMAGPSLVGGSQLLTSAKGSDGRKG